MRGCIAAGLVVLLAVPWTTSAWARLKYAGYCSCTAFDHEGARITSGPAKFPIPTPPYGKGYVNERVCHYLHDPICRDVGELPINPEKLAWFMENWRAIPTMHVDSTPAERLIRAWTSCHWRMTKLGFRPHEFQLEINSQAICLPYDDGDDVHFEPMAHEWWKRRAAREVRPFRLPFPQLRR